MSSVGRIIDLRGQGELDRLVGQLFKGDNITKRTSVGDLCETIRCAGTFTREDVARILNALAANVVQNWPRTASGSTTPSTSDVCEWLDNAADNIEGGVGLSDWVHDFIAKAKGQA